MRSHIWKVKNDNIYFLSQKTTYEHFIMRVDGHTPAFDEFSSYWDETFKKILSNIVISEGLQSSEVWSSINQARQKF